MKLKLKATLGKRNHTKRVVRTFRAKDEESLIELCEEYLDEQRRLGYKVLNYTGIIRLPPIEKE